jgi:hypothetical protein
MPAFAFHNISFTFFSWSFDKYTSWAAKSLKNFGTRSAETLVIIYSQQCVTSQKT